MSSKRVSDVWFVAVTQTNWQTRLTHRIAHEVRKRRDGLNMTAEELSDETDRLGMRIERTVIANLENRRRAAISIAEVLVLAKALRVPPVMLLLPVGDDQPTAEVLPGKIASTWAAARWVTGEGPFAADDAGEEMTHEDLHEWQTGAVNLDRYRTHDQCVRDLTSILRKVNNPLFEQSATLSERKLWRESVDGLEEVLRALRALMRQHGISVPQLPARLRYIDPQMPQPDDE